MFTTVSQRVRASAALVLSLSIFIGAAVCLVGCGKNTPPNSQLPASSSETAPILKFHWLGKQRLATEANATNFMAIWNLPESARLEAQTLDKLATAPWRLWATNVPLSNAPSALLRPLLDDLVQHEVYVEATGGTNQPTEYVIALRLPADRAALWETNLPAIVSSLGTSGGAPGAGVSGSQLPTPIAHLLSGPLRIIRTNDWTLLSLIAPGPQGGEAANSTSSQPLSTNSHLLSLFTARLATNAAPYAARATNYLVEILANAQVLPKLAALKVGSAEARTVALNVFGDSANLRLRGGVDFSEDLRLTLPPWDVPTNLMQAPLIGFTALRGSARWLESLPGWQENKLGAAPDQFYFWSNKNAPWLHLFAALSPAPETQFLALKDFVLDRVNLALGMNRTGEFAWVTNEAKVVWKGVPFCSPTFLQQSNWIVGGFSTPPPGRRPIPMEYVQQLNNTSNLLYYDWELTGEQVPSWTQIGQLMRMAFSYAQMPHTNAGLPWLNTIGTNLAYSVTTVSLEKPTRLSFARAATLGLNSIELQLLADWLESPDFPTGIHTLDAPRDYLSERLKKRPAPGLAPQR